MHASQRAPSGVKIQPNSSQDEVIGLLSDTRTYSPAAPLVERMDTHGAIVFLAATKPTRSNGPSIFPIWIFRPWPGAAPPVKEKSR